MIFISIYKTVDDWRSEDDKTTRVQDDVENRDSEYSDK